MLLSAALNCERTEWAFTDGCDAPDRDRCALVDLVATGLGVHVCEHSGRAVLPDFSILLIRSYFGFY